MTSISSKAKKEICTSLQTSKAVAADQKLFSSFQSTQYHVNWLTKFIFQFIVVTEKCETNKKRNCKVNIKKTIDEYLSTYMIRNSWQPNCYDHIVWHSWLAKKVLYYCLFRTRKIKWWLPMFGWIKNGMTNCSHGTQRILEASLALESLVTSFGYQILCYTTSKSDTCQA